MIRETSWYSQESSPRFLIVDDRPIHRCGPGQDHKGEIQTNLEHLTKPATHELQEALSHLPNAHGNSMKDIVQRAKLDASHRALRDIKETAVICCGHEANLAHEIQEQMDKKRDMLIVNLSAMRRRQTSSLLGQKR